jgi:hypothetical protein
MDPYLLLLVVSAVIMNGIFFYFHTSRLFSFSDYVPRRADRRDSGIDTYPTDHKWFDRSVKKFIPTAKFAFQGGSWVFQAVETHDEL